MIPVDQTRFGVPHGNCFSACVASILELKLADVPFFMDQDEWFVAFNRWLEMRGLWAAFFPLRNSWRPHGLWIAGGTSSRGPHAVVFSGELMIHDPHPSREGISTIEDATILVPFDPARCRKDMS